jgi:excisionase family DNA binding protein
LFSNSANARPFGVCDTTENYFMAVDTKPPTEVATLLTDATAAAFVGGVKARAIRDWRMRRGLPFIRVTGKVIRIRKADLDRWLAQHLVAIKRRAI